MKYRNHEFGISCENHSIEEYAEMVEEGERTVSCYIPSEAGKEFVIDCVNESEQLFGVELFMDGHRLDKYSRKPAAPGTSKLIENLSTSPNTTRSFVFSKLSTTDEETLTSREDHLIVQAPKTSRR
ncbi:hypothetical protein A0H81_12574 [Grifola frondosa]|uniref:DUF7918 domain-containing protein n=1 Tax=Grifola frondosa TaxID=5627 RepID=A0A1C7LTQ0_GRIFR|nr:hypothetical protein A0H81_12574 [Grifola frondosa]